MKVQVPVSLMESASVPETISLPAPRFPSIKIRPELEAFRGSSELLTVDAADSSDPAALNSIEKSEQPLCFIEALNGGI